jgi:hypothetical protein
MLALVSSPRARTARGRILHYHVNAPIEERRARVVCIICDRIVLRRRSSLRPGQVVTTCSPTCRALAMMLFPLGDRPRAVAHVDTSRTPLR